MAGNSAAANIEQFVYVSMNAMYQATISFVSQNYGAGNYHRIRKIVIRAQCCVLVVGVVLGNAATLAGRVLLSIYTTSPAVIDAGITRMQIVCATYAVCGMMDVMVGGLRGIGYSVMPMLVSLVGACGLRLLWIATIFQLPQFHTIQMLYWSYPVSWVVTFGVPRTLLPVGFAEGQAPAAARSGDAGEGAVSRGIKRAGCIRRYTPLFRILNAYCPIRCRTASTAQATRKMVSASWPHSRL